MNTSNLEILNTLAQTIDRHQEGALVTLVATEGSSPRPVGSQMFIDADGTRSGVLSSGCIEAAITEQALEALQAKQSRLLRYGKGSPWIDLQLPCGAGIDIHIAVNHDKNLVDRTRQQLSQRKPVTWALRPDNLQWVHAGGAEKPEAILRYAPERLLVVAGRGPALSSLAAIASQCEIAVQSISPEQDDLDAALPFCRSIQLLKHPNDFKAPKLDRWSGAVLLFHDHDWEPTILAQLLKTDAVYLAALGSPQSHQRRCELLREMHLSDDSIARLKGPAGLNIGARSPAEIALSIVAEFVQTLGQ